MKHESPSIPETTKPMDLKIWQLMLRTWNSVLRCNMMTSQQIQYGGRPPYWKSYFGYISASYCSINAKFGTLKQNHVLSSDQLTIFKNSIWRTVEILKIVSSLYLSLGSSDFNEIWNNEIMKMAALVRRKFHRIIDDFFHRKQTIAHNTNQIKLNNN